MDIGEDDSSPQQNPVLPQSAVLFSGLNFAPIRTLIQKELSWNSMSRAAIMPTSVILPAMENCRKQLCPNKKRSDQIRPDGQEDSYLDTDEEALNEMDAPSEAPKKIKALKRRQPSEPTTFWINKKNGFSYPDDNHDTSEQAHHPTFIPGPTQWTKTSSQSAKQRSNGQVNRSSSSQAHSRHPNNQEEDQDTLQAEYRQLHSEVERIGTSNSSSTPLSQQQRRRRILTPLSSNFSLHREQARGDWATEHLSGENSSPRGSSSPPQSTERHRRPPINIARGLIDLARGQNHSNPRAQQQRRIIHAKLQSSKASASRSISPAHPLNFAHFDEAMHPYKFDVVLQMPLPSREEMERHAWNPDDRSLNIYVKEEDRLTLHRHPVAQSTDCIRGKIGYTRGFHVWQLVWPVGQRGTHPLVGVATKECALHATGYNALIGSNTESYGWDMVQNKCYHDSNNTKGWTYPTHPSSSSIDDSAQTSDKFYCILDMDEGYMAFATSKQYLGVAFRGLKGKKLYPIVSAVWGHCEITIRYMGGLDPEPRQLMDVCRRTIRLQMGKTRLDRIHELNLPPALMHYLLYKS
uniref:Uncharacterized protein n=1 Tax=Ditylenchus dipsaci TaxID=166011 RepID=A0A915E7P3_9BILA